MGGLAYLGVRVVGGLEAQVLKTHVGEEISEETLETLSVSAHRIKPHMNVW